MTILSDPSFESSYPKVKGAEVTILLNNNKIISSRVDLPKGEIENPVSANELIRKFASCTSQYFSEDDIDRIWEHIYKIDEYDNINELMLLLNIR